MIPVSALGLGRVIPQWSELELVALLLPGVGVVVVAVALPEAGPVAVQELEPAQPLGALPEVAPGTTRRSGQPCSGVERLAVGLVGEQRISSSSASRGTLVV